MIDKYLIDEKKSIKHLIKFIHGNSVKCIDCKSELDIEKISSNSFIRCKCGKKQSWKSNTIFQGTRLSARELILIKHYLDMNVEDKEISKILSLSVDTIRLWKYRFENINKE